MVNKNAFRRIQPRTFTINDQKTALPKARHSEMKSFPRWLIVASGLAMMALIGGGYWFYLYQEQVLRQNAEANLQSTAQLKVNQIAEWRSEQLRDAAVIMESPFFTDAAVQCITEPKADLTDKLLARFRSMQEHFQYRDVMLVDRDGQVRLSLSKHVGSLHEDAARSLAEALREKKPVLSDLHVGPDDLPSHIDVVTPLFSETRKTEKPVGALILQLDARQFLYPLIQFWPTPSLSAETLLVRRDGDAVLFLNDLRHQPDTALKLRIPLSRKDVPAVMAVLGKEGIVQGKDYRGVDVLCVLKAVPNSPWFMVAKVDEAEALSNWRFQSTLILALVIGLLAFLVTAVGMAWQKNGKAHYKELFLAEAALRRAEEGHRITLMSIGDGIISTDSDGRVELLNPVAEALTGWRQEEAHGKPLEEVFQIFNEETRQTVENPVTKVLSEGLVVGLANQTVLVAKDGTERPIADSGAPIRDETGLILGVVLVFRDQTQEREAQKALQQQYEQLVKSEREAAFYADLVKRSSLALGVGFPDGRFGTVNEAFFRLTGYSRNELATLDWSKILTPPEWREIEVSKLEELNQTGQPVRYEKEYIRKDGSRVPVEMVVHLVRDENGASHCYYAFVSDITDRKRAEEALRESEERFRLASESLSDVIYEWDLGSSVKWFGNIDRLLGYAPGEFPHTLEAWMDILHPNDRDRVWKAVEKQLRDEATYDIEYRVQHKEGGWRDFLARGTAVKDASGKPMRWIGAVTDITDRKRSEELALQSLRVKSVADLSSGVAHHFNNLLQIVIGNTSLSLADLESGDLSELKTNLEQMLQAATLGAETVKRLQTFANMRADITEGEAAVFDVATTARNAAQVSEPLWKSDPEKKGIKIDLQLDLMGGCLVKGQENEMFEVMVNLIRNAAEAMPQGGDVEVKSYREANEVVVNVRDTGIGIAEEDLPRVFQPFWSSKGVGIGKGMGLAVTHGLVKRHGGSMSVDSKLGAGTTFTVRLPLAQEPVRKTEQLSTSATEDRLTILVIDDDLSIAGLLERMLAKAGHSVFTALSGEEGLAVFNKERVDLVLCDLGMPGMNGWDVGKAIRSICRDRGIIKPPFVLLTGWGGQELEEEKIAESGTDVVVAKPIDSATVISTVQEIAARFH